MVLCGFMLLISTNLKAEDLTPDVTGEVKGQYGKGNSGEWEQWSFHSPFFNKETQKKFKVDNVTKLGVVFAAGNNQSLTLSGLENVNLSQGNIVNRLTGGGLYVRSETAGVTQTGSKFFFAKDKIEWHFSPHFYILLQGGWYTDEPKGVQHDYHVLPGAGYFIIDSDKLVLRTEGGYFFDYEDRVSPNADATLHSILGAMALTYKPNTWTICEAQTNLILRPNDPQDFRMGLQADIAFKLIKFVYLATGFELRFDNQPVTGFKKFDTILSASVVLRL